MVMFRGQSNNDGRDTKMSRQADDYMFIDRRKFTLIDIERGKQIITCADFGFTKDDYRFPACTACWRGYTAEYTVESGKLHGIKTLDRDKELVSSKVFIPFTGACIIAYGQQKKFEWRKEWEVGNSDFIAAYIEALEAYELYFECGVLLVKIILRKCNHRSKRVNTTSMGLHQRTRFKRLVGRRLCNNT
jgi:hypothetical protein